jgi:signal transduction histidine kinase
MRHLPLERKIERLGAAMAFLGDAIEEVRQAVKSLHKSNSIQNVDIAVLKTRAALYGGVAAAVVSPLVVLVVELLLRHMFK